MGGSEYSTAIRASRVGEGWVRCGRECGWVWVWVGVGEVWAEDVGTGRRVFRIVQQRCVGTTFTDKPFHKRNNRDSTDTADDQL